MLIKNGSVFTKEFKFEEMDLVSKDKKTDALLSRGSTTSEHDTYDASECYIIPGLTDIHFHGCVGHDFCDGSKEAIHEMAKYELKNGVTTICPATMTLAEFMLHSICTTAADYVNHPVSDQEAKLCGINMEGPFISLAKKGAQNPAFITTPDSAMFHRLQESANGLIKLVAIAPEEDNALAVIDDLKDDVVLSIAHTTADYETSSTALRHGASHVTHLYNAMPPFSHRDPGVVGAAFDAKHCNVELITDGIHISPSMVRATFQLFGDERVILVSDSMMATGMEDGKYSLGGLDVYVTGNKATLKDGTIAGSATNLMDCMRTAVSMGIPLESAVRAATYNPAKAIGIDVNYGTIEPGKVANYVILNKDLSIKNVILNGSVVI